MYFESIGNRKTLGDVDIVFHDGIYHLFHLVLPNHDFVAHAVSNDCFHWRRVENAIVIGDPGSFDDSMLWTMHVSRDPHRDGEWRMFYTGLSRKDCGLVQRVGLARSNDLFRWTKAAVNWVDRRSKLPYELPGRPPQPPFEVDPQSCYPISPDPEFYESNMDQGRHWVSFRDPFYYRERDRGWLLVAGRVDSGPITRRGCVAVLEEVKPNQFEPRAALFHPGLYDDIEVPNLFQIDGQYYLIGSIREDATIRYWHTDKIGNPWRSHADNVLLGSGNYAGRIAFDDQGVLLWSFYTPGGPDRTHSNLMPPPKRLVRNIDGNLEVRSFEGFESRVGAQVDLKRLCSLKPSAGGDRCIREDAGYHLKNESGFQAFVFEENVNCFRVSANLRMIGEGKCGLVFRLNRDTHDGYYLSLDLSKGVAQLRAWGSSENGRGENMLEFRALQQGFWKQDDRNPTEITLLVHGSYIEVSIAGSVLLSLADQRYKSGAAGFYVESAELQVDSLMVEHLETPIQSDEHLSVG